MMQKQNNNKDDKFWLDELQNNAAVIKKMDEKQRLEHLRNWVEEFDSEFLKGCGRKLKIG